MQGDIGTMMTDRPMDCQLTERRLNAFLDRELPAQERHRVAQHLDRCAACRSRLRAQRALRQELTDALPLIGRSVEDGRFEVIWREIAAQIAAMRRRRISMRRLVTSSAALAAAFTVALAWSPPSPAASVPTQPMAAERIADVTQNAASAPGRTTRLSPPLRSTQQPALTPLLEGNYAPPFVEPTESP